MVMATEARRADPAQRLARAGIARKRRRAAFFTLGFMLAAVQAMAAPSAYRVDDQASYFAVITHADGLGHDHLITATGYRADLNADPATLAATTFTLSVPVENLEVNMPADTAALWPRLRALGIVEERFPELSTQDRATITERIRSDAQLDAASHPTVSARLIAVSREAVEWNDHTFPQQVDIALTVRGVTVERRVPASVTASGRQLRASAVGEFRFREFGIEPFSSALGLLRVADTFHVYVELRAEPLGSQ